MSVFHLHGIVREYSKDKKAYDVVFTHDYTKEEELRHQVYISKKLDAFEFHSDIIDAHFKKCMTCLAYHIKKDRRDDGSLDFPYEIWHTS